MATQGCIALEEYIHGVVGMYSDSRIYVSDTRLENRIASSFCLIVLLPCYLVLLPYLIIALLLPCYRLVIALLYYCPIVLSCCRHVILLPKKGLDRQRRSRLSI